MSQHRKKYILTLVCTLLFLLSSQDIYAAPSTELPPDPIDSGLHPVPVESAVPRADVLESTQITPVPGSHLLAPGETPLIPTRKLSDEAVFIAVGGWNGAIVDTNLNDSFGYFRIGKSLYETAMVASEYTFDLTSTGNFGWSVGYKFLQDLAKSYEPYLKIAIAALYAPSEQLATFINWERYQLRGEVGCDDLFQRQRSLRAELGASWSGFGVGIYAGLAYAF